MATDHVFHATMVFSNTETDHRSSFGFYGHGKSGGDPTVGGIGVELEAWWEGGVDGNPALKTYYAEAISLELITLRMISPLEPFVHEYVGDLPSPGTATGGNQSAQTATIISHRSNAIGKSHRNRSYLPSMADSAIASDGQLGATEATNLIESWTALMGILDAGTNFAPAIWSPLLGTYDEWAFSKVDRELRTQRRRQPRTTNYVTV